jgi:hypothetical protein
MSSRACAASRVGRAIGGLMAGEKKTDVQLGAAAMGRARWKGVSKEERSRILKAARAHGGGRSRSEDRCYCGARTWHSATIRRFDCCKRAGKFPAGRQK